MIISSLAAALAERYSTDFLEEALLTKPDPLHIEITAPVLARPSIEQIFSCFLRRNRDVEPWLLSVYSKRFDYIETSLNSANVTIYNHSLPATEIIGISGRLIPITRVIEGSPKLNPFFLRDHVIIGSVIKRRRIDWDRGRWMPVLTFRVIF